MKTTAIFVPRFVISRDWYLRHLTSFNLFDFVQNWSRSLPFALLHFLLLIRRTTSGLVWMWLQHRWSLDLWNKKIDLVLVLAHTTFMSLVCVFLFCVVSWQKPWCSYLTGTLCGYDRGLDVAMTSSLANGTEALVWLSHKGPWYGNLAGALLQLPDSSLGEEGPRDGVPLGAELATVGEVHRAELAECELL